MTSSRVVAGQLVRFLALGVVNTGLTFALLVVLQGLMTPQAAFTLVFALGVAFTTTLTSRVVFQTRSSALRLVLFAAWYVAVYIVGRVVIAALEPTVDSSAGLAAAVVAVTAPLSFLGGRLLLAGRRPAPRLNGDVAE